MGLDTAALNSAILAGLGEAGGVVFHVPAGSPPAPVDVPMEAAYRGPWSGTSVVGAIVEQQGNQLMVRSSDYRAAGIVSGDGTTVTARGAEWTVLDGQPDDGGMTLVSLAPVPA